MISRIVRQSEYTFPIFFYVGITIKPDAMTLIFLFGCNSLLKHQGQEGLFEPESDICEQVYPQLHNGMKVFIHA